MAQLDRLGPAKEVARLASVIGRDFSYDLLAAIADVDADTLRRGLAQLVEEEVVYRKGAGQVAGGELRRPADVEQVGRALGVGPPGVDLVERQAPHPEALTDGGGRRLRPGPRVRGWPRSSG